MSDMIATRTLLGGRYELLTTIGSGVSADVYVAKDRVLSRRVAVKRLRPTLSEDAKFLNLFKAEAKISAQLNHHNILAIYDWGQDDGVYLVSELLLGGTLRAVLREQKTIEPAQAIEVGLQAARGLEAAHEKNLVHRDIKPANLLFDKGGRLRIADFGVARAVAESSWTELTGTFVGTVRYAAPEQMKRRSGDQPIDSRADIYALGLCLAEMITGEVPLSGEDAFETISLRKDSNVKMVLEEAPALAELINKCCLIEPADRPTASECIRLLNIAAAQTPKPEPLNLVELSIDEEHLVELESDEDTEVNLELSAADDIAVVDDIEVIPSRLSRAQDWYGSLSDDQVMRIRLLVAGLFGLFFCVYLFMNSLNSNTETLVSLSNESTGVESSVEEPTTVASEEDEPPVEDEEGDEASPLTTSDAQQLSPAPAVVGLSVAEAEALVESLGFELGEQIALFSATVPKGQVISLMYQGSPVDSSARLRDGSVVQLRVSDGPEPVLIPNIYGYKPAEAAEILEQAGFNTQVEYIFTEALSKGFAVATEPLGEGYAVEGTTVTIKVSNGRETISVPNVVGQTGTQAKARLEELGLAVKSVGGDISNKVVQTQPAAGAQVENGDTITILTGIG